MKATTKPNKVMLTAKGIAALRRAKDAILEEPLRLDMKRWIDTPLSGGPSCGTVGCIAGWVVLSRLADVRDIYDVSDVSRDILRRGFEYVGTMIRIRAARMIGLPLDDLMPLFHHEQWGDKDYQAYELASPDGRAGIVARKIEEFIRAHSRKKKRAR